jgi:hypothetical protein
VTPRDRVLSMLHMRASATQKELLNHLGGDLRERRDDVYDAIRALLAEGVIEIVNQQRITSLRGGQAVAGTRGTRYRIVGGDR